MRTCARVDHGVVMEVVLPYANDEGEEIPIGERFTADFVAQMVDITELDPQPDQRWTYDGSVFTPPPPYVPPVIDVIAENAARQTLLKENASKAMTPVLLSFQLNNATEAETATAVARQGYYRELELVNLSAESPDWPVLPG